MIKDKCHMIFSFCTMQLHTLYYANEIYVYIFRRFFYFLNLKEEVMIFIKKNTNKFRNVYV